MDKKQSKRLKDLVQLDIDAVHAYERAIEKIEEAHIAGALRQFQQDHERHIARLSTLLESQGERPPERKPDLKGYLIEGITALRSATGTKGALKAMNQNEALTNRQYSEASQMELDQEARLIVEEGLTDERRHKEFIEGALEAIKENRLHSYGTDVGQEPLRRAE